MSHQTYLHSDMTQPFSYDIGSNASNVHGQYPMKSVQMVRPNLAPATKQDTEPSQLAAYNTGEQPTNSTNQATHTPMTDIYTKQQKEFCFQQKEQQCDENQILEFLNIIEPQSSHQSHQDVDEGSVTLLHLPSSHNIVKPPIQTVCSCSVMAKR